jgi:hypothetical protein
MARKKLIDERAALRSTFDKEINARRRKLEELNKQKRQLPISKDIKDSKKVVALNLEHLEARERAVEIQIKRSISTGQDRASSKELGVIAAQRRQVKEVRTTIIRINPHRHSTQFIIRRFSFIFCLQRLTSSLLHSGPSLPRRLKPP